MRLMITARTFRSDLLLLLTAAIWGGGFVAQRIGMESVGPFTFNAVRFGLGSLALLLLIGVCRRPRPEGQASARGLMHGGGLAGLALFMGATMQQVGIVYTTAGKAGFITGLYVVIVPILGLLWRRRPDRATWAGAFLAAAGLYFLSVTKQFTIESGDLLVLVGAVFWAVHVLVIGWVSPKLDALCLSCIQFGVCSALSAVTAIVVEPIRLEAIAAAAPAILYSGLISVGVAYTLQVVAQKDADPTHAAIILSMEAVFAAVGGWLILNETFSVRGLIGCGLVLAGMLLSQVPILFDFRRRTRAYPPGLSGAGGKR